MGLHIARLALSLTASLPEHVFERHMPSSPQVVGDELAQQVDAHVRANQLGYYPALDYFQGRDEVDKYLLEAAEHMGWFVANLVREEIQRKLRPVFSSISFQAVQSVAFTLPQVRPANANALTELREHYTPNRVKISMIVTTIQKRQNEEALAGWARQAVTRWLKESFERLEITSAQLLVKAAPEE